MIQMKSIAVGLERIRSIANRLGVNERTVERWIDAGIFPRPQYIRGKRFWPSGLMPDIDKEEYHVKRRKIARHALKRATQSRWP